MHGSDSDDSVAAEVFVFESKRSTVWTADTLHSAIFLSLCPSGLGTWIKRAQAYDMALFWTGSDELELIMHNNAAQEPLRAHLEPQRDEIHTTHRIIIKRASSGLFRFGS